jgi:hypothetical protein
MYSKKKVYLIIFDFHVLVLLVCEENRLHKYRKQKKVVYNTQKGYIIVAFITHEFVSMNILYNLSNNVLMQLYSI